MFLRYNINTQTHTQHRSLYKTMDGNLAKLEEGIMQLEVILTPKNYDPETQYTHFDGYEYTGMPGI